MNLGVLRCRAWYQGQAGEDPGADAIPEGYQWSGPVGKGFTASRPRASRPLTALPLAVSNMAGTGNGSWVTSWHGPSVPGGRGQAQSAEQTRHCLPCLLTAAGIEVFGSIGRSEGPNANVP